MNFKAERRATHDFMETQFLVVDDDAGATERIWCIVQGSTNGQRAFRAQQIVEKMNKGSIFIEGDPGEESR
jgi:hypothetical protein